MTDDDIELRRLHIDDAELISEWLNDKENIKYMSTVVRCKNHSKESIERNIKHSDPTYEQEFIIILKDSKRPVGYCGIDGLDLYDKTGEIFFLLGDKTQQGKGFGKKSVRLLLDYAFKEMGLNNILGTATVENKSSIIVMEKAGFKRIGIRREYNYIDGEFMDEVMLDMIYKDYKELYERSE